MKKIIFMLCVCMLVGCSGEKPHPQPLSGEERGVEQDSVISQATSDASVFPSPLIKGDGGGFVRQNNESDTFPSNPPPSSGHLPPIKGEEIGENTASGNLSPLPGGDTAGAGEGGNGEISGTNIQLTPNIISTHSNTFIELENNSVEEVLYVTIGGYSYELTEHETKYYFEIQKNTFTAGEYFISVQYPDGTIVGLDQKMIVQAGQDNKINLRNITPDRITNETDTTVVLQGNGFEKVISVQLNNNIVLKEAHFDIINDQVMSIDIPAGISKGDYFFNLLTLEKVVKLSQNSLSIDTP